MKFFISIGYTNRSIDEINKEKERLIKYIKQRYGSDSEIIDSHITDSYGNDVKSIDLWYMAKSLEKMCIADKVVFAHDWEKYRGCEIEYKMAEAYHMDIIDLGHSLY